MKIGSKYILTFITILAVSIIMPAQELPLLPADKAVTNGMLPNGMSYYLVANPTSKGVADFALVQRTGSETGPEEFRNRAVDVSRKKLADLPRLKGDSPQSFMARHGVMPGKNGFVEVTPNATVYRFEDVLVSEVVDSALLVLLDIADMGTFSDDVFLKEWYAPSDQALVVSGDIDVKQVAEKLRLMSYMTPPRTSMERSEYKWLSSDEPVFETPPYMVRKMATVTATWVSPRTPKEYMNTVQPAIYEMFIGELGILAVERICRKLKAEDIPYGDVSYDHLDSVRSLGDEAFTVSVSVAPEDADAAIEILASVMSSLDSGNAASHEVEMARKRYFSKIEAVASTHVNDNTDYLDRCIASFLYNAPLSSEKEIISFLQSRDLDPETELNLFNNVAGALLDSRENLTVECRIGGGLEMDSNHLMTVFSSAWEAGRSDSFRCPSPLDSLPLPGAGLPVKVKSFRKEPVSGGILWTFANGFKVAYKRQETGRRLYYSLALNGGYGNIRNLSEGEGAYMSDYLSLCRISGVSADDFSLYLEDNDMTMDAVVNLSNTIISGSVPDKEQEFLMRILLGMANGMESDEDALGYYNSCSELHQEFSRGSVHDRILAIDSLMCPDYIYSSLKYSGRMSSEFMSKADDFLRRQTGKMNDGLLVLVGNIEETKMRKMLQKYVGGFSTTDRTFARTIVHYQPVSGCTTYTRKGMDNSIDVAMSVRLPFTADNYMASKMAAEVLKHKVSEAIDGTGMFLRISHNHRIYPEERFNLMITLEEASPDGFAQGSLHSGPEKALAELRNLLSSLSDIDLEDSDLGKLKSVMKNRIALEMQTPQYWRHAITMRYLDGKDLTTGYQAKIDGVTAQKVKSILISLADASKVEYIIEK